MPDKLADALNQMGDALDMDLIGTLLGQIIRNFKAGVFSYAVACVEFNKVQERALKRLLKTWN